MGKLLNFEGSADLSGVDPRLVAIVEEAAKSSPYDVRFKDGMRVGGLGNHKNGFAIDVELVNPVTKVPLPNKMYVRGTKTVIPGAIEAYPAYENLAQTARGIQKAKYPALTNVFRWGGGFRKGGTPFDMMHFDITPGAAGSMKYYNWETGATDAAKAVGLGFTSYGKLAVDPRVVAQLTMQASGGKLPPGSMSNEVVPVSRPASIDQKRADYANLQATPLPRPRPNLVTGASPGASGVAPQPAAAPYQPVVAGRPGTPGGLPAATSAAAAPVPATMSPALAAARQRLAAAREAKGIPSAYNSPNTPAQVAELYEGIQPQTGALLAAKPYQPVVAGRPGTRGALPAAAGGPPPSLLDVMGGSQAGKTAKIPLVNPMAEPPQPAVAPTRATLGSIGRSDSNTLLGMMSSTAAKNPLLAGNAAGGSGSNAAGTLTPGPNTLPKPGASLGGASAQPAGASLSYPATTAKSQYTGSFTPAAAGASLASKPKPVAVAVRTPGDATATGTTWTKPVYKTVMKPNPAYVPLVAGRPDPPSAASKLMKGGAAGLGAAAIATPAQVPEFVPEQVLCQIASNNDPFFASNRDPF